MSLLRRHLLFGGYCLVVGLANWPVLSALYQHSIVDNRASHVILIPLVTAGLIWLNRRRIFQSVETASSAGVAVIATGIVVLAATWPYRLRLGQDPALTVVMASLVVLWVGGFVLLYGRTAARVALFPLVFLVLTMPFPESILVPVNNFLKDGSTETVAGLFTLTGTPYYREDYVFKLPYFAIFVADACSGIRSSIGLFITSLLAGHLFLRTSWKKSVLVLAVVPITLVKNGIRIVTLSLLATHVDRSFLTGQLHHDGGIVFFGLSLLMLAPILLLLRRSDVRRAPPVHSIPDAKNINALA